MVTMKEAMMAMEELMNDMAMTVSALKRSYIHIQSSLLHYYHSHHCYYYSAAHGHGHGHGHHHPQRHEKKLVMMMKQADRAMVHHLTNLSHLINTSYMQNMSQLHMLLLGFDPSNRNHFSNPNPRNDANARNPIDPKVNNPNSSIPNPINSINPSKPTKLNPISPNLNPRIDQLAENSLHRGNEYDHDKVVMHVLRSHPHDDEDINVGEHNHYVNRFHHHHHHDRHEISNNNSSHLLYNVKSTMKTTSYDDNDNDGDDEEGTPNYLNHQDTPWKKDEEIILKKTRSKKTRRKEKIGNLYTSSFPQNRGEMLEVEDRQMRSSVHDMRTDREHHLINAPDPSVRPDSPTPTPELLERAVLSASEASRSFTKLMISFMKKSGWDLQLASNAIEPGVKYMQKRHTKFAFESYVNHAMLNGFESESFDYRDRIDNHSDVNDGHHDKKRSQVECYKEFQDLMPMMMMMMMTTSKDMAFMDHATIKSGLLLNDHHDHSELANMLNIDEYIRHYDAILSNPKSKFSQYCMHRFLDVVHPKMEEAFFGSLDDHRKQILEHGAHPKTPFYHSFLKLAMAMWMLHKLVFSFPSLKDDENNCAHIFGVEKNARFSSLYMESIVQNIQNLDESMDKSNGSNTKNDIDHIGSNHKHDECDGTQPKSVAFTVMPGFRVGEIVIKCQVYVTNLVPHMSQE